MNLDLLPVRHGGAAENMAADFLLLKRYPESGHVRCRHYGWHRPAFTFGYSQKIEFVRAQLPAEERFELCRRPTGGGVVDHRDDWTYALVIPAAHPLCDARALDSYRAIHASIARALVAGGCEATLKESCEASEVKIDAEGGGGAGYGAEAGAGCAANSAAGGSSSSSPAGAGRGPGVCFARAELYDVIQPVSGVKIAGAAQKRTRDGLLFQGSLARAACPATFDWEAFGGRFFAQLAEALEVSAEPAGFPDFGDGVLEALIEQYSAEEWTAGR